MRSSWYGLVIVALVASAVVALFAVLAAWIVSDRDVPPNVLSLLGGLLTLIGTLWGAIFASRTVTTLRGKEKGGDGPDGEPPG